ncbi:MAG: PEP/pyruvate-binding domain-containing protein, partial [Cyanobacteria bacterium J06576_12]
NVVLVESLPGDASQVVSGQITPERYQVSVGDVAPENDWNLSQASEQEASEQASGQKSGQKPAQTIDLPVQGIGQTPKDLILQVAYLARHIEQRFHGVPQDIEWTFDGEQLWVLQSRPITTLTPIWTRKIAAEVIPGLIRPLTWSINQPLTCGVWGDLFTTVLKERTQGLDFSQTAALHFGRAYFNATLLGDIFTRMGLPAQSLEFLTRGAKFQRPPLITTLRNVPGLLRLWQQERQLPKDFAKAQALEFAPAMSQWQQQPITQLSPAEIGQRIETILGLLERATYFNILAPLSLALRQAVLKVDLASLDSRQNPEMRALEDLKQMAVQLRSRLPELGLSSPIDLPQTQHPNNSASLFAAIAEHPE